jgi:soluble lytic murein transglycosylase
MQIMPLTGQYLSRVPMSEPWDPTVLLEPSVNVMLGVKYLAQLQARFGDIEMVLAAYNAGPSAVQRWLTRRPEDVAAFVETIPYEETRDYVAKVISWMRRFEAAEEQRLVRLAASRIDEAS